MDNQQGKVHEWEIGWLAGFIDGEGSIHFAKQTKRGSKQYVSPYIQIAGTDVPTLGRLTALLTRLELAHHVAWKENVHGFRRATGQKRKQWYVRAVGMKRCDKWLRLLFPYLTTRNDQAQLQLEFINSRFQSMIGDYSARELAIVAKVSAINRGLPSETARWLPDVKAGDGTVQSAREI